MQANSNEKTNASRGTAPPSAALSPEDQARADLYALIASLLIQPPDSGLLGALATADALPSGHADNPLDHSWEQLVLAASVMDTLAVREEFDALFISASMPLINPYGSRYLAGFMMEKPLAALRDDLAVLGLGRKPGVGETEDHLGALCEVMRALITGVQGPGGQVAGRTIAEQRTFFLKHIAPWYRRCLDDIRDAECTNFYRHVANFTDEFFRLESEAFEMDDAIDDALASV